MTENMNTQPLAPLFSNADLETMTNAIRDKTSQDSAYELLVRVRGTYERERATLLARVAELESQLAEARERRSAGEAAYDDIEHLMFGSEAATRWQLIDIVPLEGGLTLDVDGLAMTVGEGNTALATYRWPDDGYEYGVCRKVSGADDDA